MEIKDELTGIDTENLYYGELVQYKFKYTDSDGDDIYLLTPFNPKKYVLVKRIENIAQNVLNGKLYETSDMICGNYEFAVKLEPVGLEEKIIKYKDAEKLLEDKNAGLIKK